MTEERKDPYGPCYRAMRPSVLARNDGRCQFCGVDQSEQTHHALVDYPDHSDLQEDQLTALCSSCHDLATTIRKWVWRWNAPVLLLTTMLREATEDPAFAGALRERLGGGARKIKTADSLDAPARKMADSVQPAIETPDVVERPVREMRPMDLS